MRNDAFLSAVRLEELEVKYTKMLEEDPASDCFVPLSQLLMARGETDGALKVLTRGVKYNKENFTARYLLGKIYFERWIIDKARKELEMAIKLDPGNLDASKALLQIYSSEGNFKSALHLARNLCLCHPNNKDVRALFDQFNETDPAAKDERQGFRSSICVAESADPQSSDIAAETLANLYFDQGHYDRAAQMLDVLLKQDPFNMKLVQKRQAIRNLK